MKKLAILINILKVSISIAGVLMLIGWLISPTSWFKPLSYLATIVLPFIPDFFKIIKVQFSLPLVLAYELFIIVAMVLGVDFNWYSEVLVVANGDSYYDKIVHFSSGVLVAAVGQELFSMYLRQSGNRKPAKWSQILFLMGCVALVAVGWECYEFFYDLLVGGHMQELVKSGVADTMWDMIASLIGGGICAFCMISFFKNSPKSD